MTRRRNAPPLGSDHGLEWATFVAYAAFGSLGVAIAAARGSNPMRTTPWAHGLLAASPPWVALVASCSAGTVVAAVTIVATLELGRRSAATRALHESLRASIVGASDHRLLAAAMASGVAEELLFRGALAPLLGVVASSFLFGSLHQVQGRGRWLWVGWSTLVGLAFATIFAATGHLEGAIVGHVAINAVNLRYLRDNEPGARIVFASRLAGRQ